MGKAKDDILTLKNSIKKGPKCDLWIALIVIALSIFGIIMVFSASYYYAIWEHGNPYYYLIRQILWVASGLLLMLIFSYFDYHIWLKLWWLAMGLSLFLLVIVLIPGIGTTINEARRWIYIGPISIMPGEAAKPLFIIGLTGYFAKYPQFIRSASKGFIAVMAVLAVFVFLILKQPNMSTAFTLIFIVIGMCFVAGMPIAYVGGTVGTAMVAGVALIFSKDYRLQRYLSFFDPFEDFLNTGWNGAQSLMALGSGGLFGKGLGNSVEKDLYLPMPHNDFIMAVMGEELGFFGVTAVLAVYVLLIWRGIRTSIRAKDFEGTLLSAGIVMWIGFQVLMHLAVVTSTMPPTGIALPFISYGGNSMWLFMIGAGILLNVSKQYK